MSRIPPAISFPVPDPSFVHIQSRRRNSGLTSVRWYDDQTLFAADFSARRVYRVKPFAANPIDAEWPTLDGEDKPTETDLMDIRDDTLVVTNFLKGEVGIYSIGSGTFKFDRVIRVPTRRRSLWHHPKAWLRSLIRPSADESKGNGRRMHGAIFVPGYEDLLWVSSCDAREKGVEIITLSGKSIHALPMPEQAQDVAFIEHGGDTYAIQAARTDHITAKGPNAFPMYATIYVYLLPKNLKREAPKLLTTQQFSGHLDALKSFRGRIFGANQHDDCVDEFEFEPDTCEVKLKRRWEGFDMPHGLDIRSDGLMAVTNYGAENSMRFLQLN